MQLPVALSTSAGTTVIIEVTAVIMTQEAPRTVVAELVKPLFALTVYVIAVVVDKSQTKHCEKNK